MYFLGFAISGLVVFAFGLYGLLLHGFTHSVTEFLVVGVIMVVVSSIGYVLDRTGNK